MGSRWQAGLGGIAAGVLGFLAWNGVDIVPILLCIALAAVLWFSGALGSITAGSRTRLGGRMASASRGVPQVRFEDVGGQRTAKQELREALTFLLRPDEIRALGIRPLKGILLTGPPGTGKTLLAKAAANFTESAFLTASGSEFIEMYAGVGAQRVRQVFRDARATARREGRVSAIIFIDEIEVLAGRRGQHQSHLEYDQTVNQLLVEMDGIASDDDIRVLVMAATNRADLLDPAILRPGRLDRIVRVDLPDREARRHILDIHSRAKPLRADVDLDDLARDTFGFSGAHLESVCNEAAILALRQGASEIGADEFREAVDKVMLGERLDRTVRDRDRNRVAVHEGGHALVSELVRPGSVATVTIVPRGQALGFVRHTPDDDPLLETESDLIDDITVLLAGSAAERLLLEEASTGARNDFEKAWDIAQRMVYAGLSPLGVVHEDALERRQLFEAIQVVMERAETRAEDLLAARRETLRQLAATLIQEETVPGAQLRQWLDTLADETQDVVGSSVG